MPLFKALPWSHKHTAKDNATKPGPLARKFRGKFCFRKERRASPPGELAVPEDFTRQVEEQDLSPHLQADAGTPVVGDVDPASHPSSDTPVPTHASPEAAVSPHPDNGERIPDVAPTVDDTLPPSTTGFAASVFDVHPQPSPSDYVFYRTVSKGLECDVLAAIDRRDRKLYEVKVIRKQALSKADFAQVFMSQHAMMTVKGSPFIVDLQAAFETTKNFFVVTPLHHRSLRSRMDISGSFSEAKARSYIAQIVVALENLHGKRVLHRNLRPEKILVNSSGDLILAGFGLAHACGLPVEEQPWLVAGVHDSELPEAEGDRTREVGGGNMMTGFARTPSYRAPEMSGQSSDSYSYPADIWSVGIILFELLHGTLPFGLRHKAPLVVDPSLSQEVQQLLARLLERDPNLRAGLGEVKNHPWFGDINWDDVKPKESRSPTVNFVDCVRIPEKIRNMDLGKVYPGGDAPHPYFAYAPSSVALTPGGTLSSSESAAAASSPTSDSSVTMVGSTVSAHSTSTDFNDSTISGATTVDAGSSFLSSLKPWTKKVTGAVKRCFKLTRRRAEKRKAASDAN